MTTDAIEKLPERQQQALAMHLDGTTRAEIARRLGVNRSVVTRWFQKPVLRDALAAVRAEGLSTARDRLAHSSSKAVEVLIRTMDSDDPRLAYEAARDLLTRVGVGASQVLEVRQGVSPDELAERARSIYGVGAPALPGDVEDAEIVGDA